MIMIDMSDIFLFLFILCGVALSWIPGYVYGLKKGYEAALDEGVDSYPILNVVMHRVSEERFLFNELVTGKTIIVGTTEDCLNKIAELGDDRTVIFSSADEEQDEQSV